MKSKSMNEFENDLDAALARSTGRPARWQDTQIFETPGAIASDPLRGNFYGGDYDAVRFFPTGSDIPRRTANLVRSLEKIARPQARHRARGRRSYATDCAPIRLNLDAPAREAVAALQARSSFSKTRHAWWEALWQYTMKFPRTAKISDLNYRTVRRFLREL